MKTSVLSRSRGIKKSLESVKAIQLDSSSVLISDKMKQMSNFREFWLLKKLCNVAWTVLWVRKFNLKDSDGWVIGKGISGGKEFLLRRNKSILILHWFVFLESISLKLTIHTRGKVRKALSYKLFAILLIINRKTEPCWRLNVSSTALCNSVPAITETSGCIHGLRGHLAVSIIPPPAVSSSPCTLLAEHVITGCTLPYEGRLD